jgi:hypothetical protein
MFGKAYNSILLSTFVFDSLWNKAISARERIEELQHLEMRLKVGPENVIKEENHNRFNFILA